MYLFCSDRKKTPRLRSDACFSCDLHYIAFDCLARGPYYLGANDQNVDDSGWRWKNDVLSKNEYNCCKRLWGPGWRDRTKYTGSEPYIHTPEKLSTCYGRNSITRYYVVFFAIPFAVLHTCENLLLHDFFLCKCYKL